MRATRRWYSASKEESSAPYNTPVNASRRALLVKACLNGARRPEEHPAIPLSPSDLALDARRAVDAGAAALHVHPRLPDGSETLDPEACDAAVRAIREACPRVPVGLTTGAWIEPDRRRRLDLIGGWQAGPDFASVNFSEDGAIDVCRLLLRLGVGVEAGIWTLEDAELLIESGLADRCLRVLVEPDDEEPQAAVDRARAIDETLARAGVRLPQMHHGLGRATWAVLDAALERGRDIRIGLEDTLVLPGGERGRDNAELVAAAVSMVRERGLTPLSPA